MDDDNLVKIFFRFYSDILDSETTEVLEAETIDAEKGYFKIRMIPFYVQKIATGDVVWAEYSNAEGGMLTYRKTIEHSGNSTILAVILNDDEIDKVGQGFEELACKTRKMNNKYFALEIPADIDYLPIKSKLEEMAKKEILDYAEPCLSDKHQYKDYFLG